MQRPWRWLRARIEALFATPRIWVIAPSGAYRHEPVTRIGFILTPPAWVEPDNK